MDDTTSASHSVGDVVIVNGITRAWSLVMCCTSVIVLIDIVAILLQFELILTNNGTSSPTEGKSV